MVSGIGSIKKAAVVKKDRSRSLDDMKRLMMRGFQLGFESVERGT
jgi:hypothetical protein